MALDEYIKLVSKGNSHISPEYEKELIHLYREGTKREKAEALDILVSYNITIFADICISVINGMRGGDKIDPLDLMQLAVVTFMKKLDTWDESKGSKMITYYYREVRTQMQRFIMGNAYSIRQGSVFLQHLAYTISRIRNKWLSEKEIEPTPRELAKETGVSQNTIVYCLKVTTIQTKAIDECPTLYKDNMDIDNDQYPVLKIVEAIHNRLGLSDEASLFALYASLEDKDPLPEAILELFKKGE
tara:strand:+ start:4589 stop:5320 length:732 start_codon:yes stop_codon:yes gene_type:complete